MGKFLLLLFCIFLAGVPTVFFLAGAIASWITCGGIACAMTDAAYHDTAVPLVLAFSFVGGALLGLLILWAAWVTVRSSSRIL